MYQTAIKADVAVVGGGMAGVVAAMAAARCGAAVVLTETNGYLGGTATTSMLGELNAYTHRGRKLYGGLTAELVDGMIEAGFAQMQYAVPMTGNPAIAVDRVRYDPETLKFFLDGMLEKEKIHFFLHSTFKGIEKTDGRYRVLLSNRYQSAAIESDLVIDATGNAEVVFSANGATWKPEKRTAQAASLVFKMSGVDMAAYRAFPIELWRKAILAGYEKGVLPAKYCAINPVAGTQDVIINMTRVSDVDHESMEDMTRAEVEGRKQIFTAIPYLKQVVPGLADAYLSVIAPCVGIREARRIRGRYTLSQSDIVSGKKFEDMIAVGCYPMDIHSSNHAVEFTTIGGDGVYAIPFGSLLPTDTEGILAAGKCISVDEGAFAAVRTMPTIMAVSEAAGYAAALAWRHKTLTHDVSIRELQEYLRQLGHLQLG